jgi:hypothetical protein
MNQITTVTLLTVLLLTSLAARADAADPLAFSDPANVTTPPSWAVGQANRAADLDALPGFQEPPPGFGVVPFFWWLGDPLTKERLGWILDQMQGTGIAGYQINYAHSDKGGHSYGLTIPSEPPLFSDAWWKLIGWFMQEAKKQGAAISLSDYTLGFGQGWCVDEVLREHPEVAGMYLRMDGGGKVTPVTVPWSLNPMHRMAGKWYIEKFFGRFEQHNPGEGGKGLNFFFSDELTFGVNGWLWSASFAEEFKKRKGYDVTPELPALFKDIGPRTPKIRLDYSDVMVALTEEGYFKPIFGWHQKRGMTMGCDHGGRGQNVVEFGDYFRTQRWMQGPGADQPNLGKNLIKAKVAASMVHLYLRPRVWLEGFYGSGWGTTPAGIVDATFTDFVMGYNLLAFHGMYYSTHGGWWEWAPPDNTFRMPYWKHMRGFMGCVQRLAYLLSQGYHRCDVAIIYPVAPMEAGMDGELAVQTAFTIAQQLYGKGVDFDFMDFESLARAKVVGRELRVSGEVYRALVLPAMKAVRHSTLQKALEFKRAGEIVLAPAALPEASDRMGRADPEVAAMVKEIFPAGPTKDLFTALPSRDYDGPGCIQHRKLGPRDLYAIYNAPQGSECFFRATGKVELWDPWTGTTRPLAVTSQTAESTKLRLPLTETEIQLIVFSPGQPQVTAAAEPATSVIPVEGDWEFALEPTSDNRFGDFHWPPTPTKIGAEVRQFWYCEGHQAKGPWRKVTCSFGPQFRRSSSMPPAKDAQPYEFSWRWGIENDPGHQGYHGLKAEAHDEFLAIGQREEHGAASPNVVSYRPENRPTYFSTAVVAPRDLTAYALTGAIKPSKAWLNGRVVTGKTLQLKAGANPLVLQYDKPGRTYFVVSTNTSKEEGGEPSVFSPAAFWIWHPAEGKADISFRKEFGVDKVPGRARLRITCCNAYEVSINGTPIGSGNRWETVQEYDVTTALRSGRNEISVRAHHDAAAAGLIAELTVGSMHIVTDRSWLCTTDRTDAPVAAEQVGSFINSLWYKHPMGPPRLDASAVVEQPKFKPSNLAMRWWNDSSVLPFDVRAGEKQPVGWYRFVSPPGLRGMTVTARGKVQAWADGNPLSNVSRSRAQARFVVSKPSAKPVTVLLRIDQDCGCYGGAALPEYIQLDCGVGQIALGDWSTNEGLLSYSGGAWYRKTVAIPAARQVTLRLGDVHASAEMHVNGRLAGVKVAPPWTFDISGPVQPGKNRIEILVCNTLANHYTTVPTHYRGNTTSGLLGPVQIEWSK